MSFIIVDVEADGPIPAEYSLVCFGAVLFDEHLDKSFYGRTRPISDRFVPEALAVSGFSREEHLTFDDPKTVMEAFAAWLDQHTKGARGFCLGQCGVRLAVHQLLLPPFSRAKPIRLFR